MRFDMNNILYILKTNNVNIQQYDYIEGKTTEDDIEKYPIIKGYRYYENPYLWEKLLELNNNIEEMIDFIINDDELKIKYNYQVIIAFLLNEDKKNTKKILELVRAFFSKEFDPDYNKSMVLDNMLVSLLENDRYDRFVQVVDQFFSGKNKIEPLYGSFGNTGKDLGLQLVIKSGNLDNVKEMIDMYHAEVNYNNSLCLLFALKYRYYRIAKFLVERGYNINKHKFFARTMINFHSEKDLDSKEAEAKEYLLNVLK